MYFVIYGIFFVIRFLHKRKKKNTHTNQYFLAQINYYQQYDSTIHTETINSYKTQPIAHRISVGLLLVPTHPHLHRQRTT